MKNPVFLLKLKAMFDCPIKIRNLIIGFFYRNLLKRIFFLIDPEIVHDRMIKLGSFLGKYQVARSVCGKLFEYDNKCLEQNILGIPFNNPLGLAAGFDKDALLTDIIPSVGFGFMEVGSITAKKCEGNPKPRLWRLKKSQGLVVYYGLKNEGAVSISERLKEKIFKIPVGISIAKTNSPDTVDVEKGIEDYIETFKRFQNIGDYYTINISCPNAFGGQPFTSKEKLGKLLSELGKIKTTKPIFLKISPDLSKKEIDDIIKTSKEHRIHGFICTNLTKKRDNPRIIDKDIPKEGGLSGKIVEDLANEVISYVYRKTKGKYIIIGCGGVFSDESAYKKIKLGASLIQLITGMIFEGPQLISEINQGLVKLLRKDGYKNIGQAVGRDN